MASIGAACAAAGAPAGPLLRSGAVKWLLLLLGGGLGAVGRFAIALWVDERTGVEDGRALAALANAGASLAAGLAAVIAGVAITRQLI
jgi:fluoride ion exporter CrcB/FEX